MNTIYLFSNIDAMPACWNPACCMLLNDKTNKSGSHSLDKNPRVWRVMRYIQNTSVSCDCNACPPAWIDFVEYLHTFSLNVGYV